jgi:hypothetical protein
LTMVPCTPHAAHPGLYTLAHVAGRDASTAYRLQSLYFEFQVSPPELAFAHGRLEEKRRSLNMPAELVDSWTTGS